MILKGGSNDEKGLILALALVLCLTAFACEGGKTTGEEPKVYNTVADYSGIQGYRNWYYLTARDTLTEAQPMIWDDVMCTWRMNDINCLIEPHIVHPGQLDQVIRAWKAPKDGKIAFTSQLQRRPVNPNGVGQDGCEVYVAKTDDDYLFSQVYDALDLELHEIGGETDMKAGEMIYFVLSCSGNYTFDQTYWEITIEYLP